jgi:putative FmdB family regulatory protein
MCPAYDWTCSKCGTFEVIKSMRDPDPKRCPTCKSRGIERVFNTRVAFIPPVDSLWHLENGGRGRHITQLGMPGEEGTYARARHEIPDLAKRKGFQRIERC